MPYIPDEIMETVLNWLDTYSSRNFTKRQTQIMALLLTLTIRQGGIRCYIPKLSYFEQCGISKTKIREELEKLEELNVILWDREQMIFVMNPNTDEWKAPAFKTFDKVKYKSLIDINLPVMM
jgi:hypothetical protein